MCFYLCEICGKNFAGPVTLKIHKRVHISDNLEIVDDFKRPEAQEEPGNTDEAKDKIPTTEVFNEVFNFNIFSLNKKSNTSTSAKNNDITANSTVVTFSNEANKANEINKEFEKNTVPNEEKNGNIEKTRETYERRRKLGKRL